MDVISVNVKDAIPYLGRLTACIGYFDGVHKGHQQLLKTVMQQCSQDGSKPTLITFDPDPWTILKGIQNPSHLTLMQDRMDIGASFGITTWVILTFDSSMANLSISSFHTLLKDLGIQTLVCGSDFHYAEYGKGDVQSLLAQSEFHVIIGTTMMDSDQKISSSQIEKLIETGQMEHANTLLGYSYTLRGTVIDGSKIGRTIGFPTANIALLGNYIIPYKGVYAGMVRIGDESFPAMINIGHNPTINQQQNVSIEAHILDFNRDIYGVEVAISCMFYMREEQTFQSIEGLILQLQKDVENTRRYISEGVIKCD